MFWRVPKEFSASDLQAIVSGLAIDESGLAPGADAIQPIVSQVIPDFDQPQATSNHHKKDKAKKKKQDDAIKRKKGKGKSKKVHRRKRSQTVPSSNTSTDDDNSNNETVTERTSERNTAMYANRKEIDPDTSDSGLDPEIEAQELKTLQELGKKKLKRDISARSRKMTNKENRKRLNREQSKM